ncbi:rap1 GTPase-GDP dissociation stimulator 1 [Bradysia coprophila]|uniref:rap1 GTPase-GDP dissociation stimulator 1 n=1 Tax=Bradysia coprophila TaxID=38358 RepID=UPI00187DBE03|nr:rap1 GTPase-GDP dissociation stimulator 1 [Bradysia coprophila]
MTNEITELINRLESTQIDTESVQIIEILDKLADTDPPQFDQIPLHKPLLNLLNHSSVDVKTKVAKFIAEISKTENQRKQFTDIETLRKLIGSIENVNLNSNFEYVIQVCRALGNIMFENSDARDILANISGDKTLVELLDVRLPDVSETSIQFMKVRCGLISNYLVGGEEIAKRAMDLQILKKIEQTVELCSNDVENSEDLLLNTLPPLSILTENVQDLNFVPALNQQLVKILSESKNPDIAEMILDLLLFQAENDDVKLLLAKEGLCETIYKLLEKYKTLANTSEARALMKLACDLVVLILTGDDSMHYLYTETPLLKYIEDWLDSYDIDLLTTGVLALGNFARTDSHCIFMVENNIMKKLLEILSKNNGIDNDMRLQHALLSALRNLVIPKPNKPAVCEAGLVQTILPMLEIHQPPVVFKLLGTLRMTVDGQEKLAHELLQNEKLIKQLVLWSKSSDYANVTGESCRLMAWLVKHAYFRNRDPTQKTPVDLKSLLVFVKVDGAVDSMVSMMCSQHLVMQNEALIALCIIVAVLNGNRDDVNLDELLVKCELGQRMSEFLAKSSDTMTKEIVENLQSLMSLLRKSETLISHLDKHNIDESLKSIPILTEYCTL